ncbi:hypothetical protein [Methylocella sp.]|jgi:DNA-binding Lrp family transcriptional regulator|uniref:hypothetical protein n=1 Tax=Methylocella sp. TaxID=1978226 RepID=UPI003C216550
MSQIATETDEIEEQILERSEDGPRSIAQLASVTGMRIKACRQRVLRLTDAGLIGDRLHAVPANSPKATRAARE